MTSSFVTDVDTAPSESRPGEAFDLEVKLSRPLGGEAETVSVPVACRDGAYPLMPATLDVTFAKDAAAASAKVRGSISGSPAGSWVDLVVEAKLNGTAVTTHRLKAV